MDTQEPQITCADDPAPWTRFKPGIYDLRCTSYKCERVRMYGNAWKLRLMFRFADMENPGRIVKFFHMGRGEQPKAGRKSEYFRAWLIANGGKLPRKGSSMSPRVFTGRIFRCEVRDVTRTLDPAICHPEAAIYSTVGKILELAVG